MTRTVPSLQGIGQTVGESMLRHTAFIDSRTAYHNSPRHNSPETVWSWGGQNQGEPSLTSRLRASRPIVTPRGEDVARPFHQRLAPAGAAPSGSSAAQSDPVDIRIRALEQVPTARTSCANPSYLFELYYASGYRNSKVSKPQSATQSPKLRPSTHLKGVAPRLSAPSCSPRLLRPLRQRQGQWQRTQTSIVSVLEPPRKHPAVLLPRRWTPIWVQ